MLVLHFFRFPEPQMPGQSDQVGQVYDYQYNAQQRAVSQRKGDRKDKEHHHEHPDHSWVRDVFLH